MIDETLSAEPGLETATPEAAEPQTPELETQQIEGDAEQPEGELPEGEQTLELEELEEFEWEGKQVKGPKGLRDGLLRQADYTRKTQEVAAKARELEEREQRIAQQAQVSEEELQHRATLHHVNSQLEQYANVNWQQLEQEDPLAAQQHWRYYQQLKDAKQETSSKITEAEQKRTQDAERDFATRVEQTLTYAREKIPGWTPDTHQKVVKFVESQNLPISTVKQFWGPQLYEILHAAMIGKSAMSKATAPKPQAQQPAPLRTVGAKSSPPTRKSLAEMDMDEYVAARQAKRG